jgi:hypothetical protein
MKHTRLVDLKKGDKFYAMDWDDERVYQLLDLTIIQDDDSEIRYTVKELGSNSITKHGIKGEAVVNTMLVIKFKGKDKGSYMAGYKAAMRNYHKYMQVFDKENAGLNNDLQCWITMNKEYENWTK